jgi:oligopeptide transport system substrate-binding protein
MSDQSARAGCEEIWVGGKAVNEVPGSGQAMIGSAGRSAGLAMILLAVLPLATLAGCRNEGETRPVVIDIVGSTAGFSSPLRNSHAATAQTTLAATAQGLVSFEARGDIVAALAESWIVADGGQSYIFRLRRTTWANGEPVRADTVARLVSERFRASQDLLGGLRPEVRAMTERVIEIRLPTAVPSFLQVLAHPRLSLLGKDGGAGPFVGQWRLGRLYLRPRQAEATSDGQDVPEINPAELRTLEAGRAAVALARYQIGRADLVLGLRFQDLLLIRSARLGSNDVRADPVPGLFGFALVGRSAFLSSREVRDALSRSIDRAALARDLNLQGWVTTTTPLPAALDIGRPPTLPDWSKRPIEERVAAARKTVEAWTAANGNPPVLRIALPAGAGSNLLFYRLASDLRRLGLRLDRVDSDDPADLRLIDAVAGFDSALWYLAQLDCASGLRCDPDAAVDLDDARNADSAIDQSIMLSEAERRIVAHAGYIPLGLPIRWSLVSRRLTGFAPSPRGFHPLNRLLAQPN